MSLMLLRRASGVPSTEGMLILRCNTTSKKFEVGVKFDCTRSQFSEISQYQRLAESYHSMRRILNEQCLSGDANL
jgi:hypothetical protein